MKLYATIEADKLQDGKHIIVKKAQGSNKYLQVNIVDEYGALIACLQITARPNDKPVGFFARLPQHGYITEDRTEYETILSKGKKQKDL